MPKPSVFIGSSTEGIEVAEAIQQALAPIADVEVWTQGVFNLSEGYLESLLKTMKKADFAVLALSPDDLVVSRGQESRSPRDNVLFELGLFMGQLGRERCFFVYDRTKNLKIPTDLLGICAATFRPHANGNLQAALGAACTSIKRAIESLGRRPALLRFYSQDVGAAVELPDVSGSWSGYSPDAPDPNAQISTLHIKQKGSFIRARVERQVRNGLRHFEYEGRFTSGQLILFFEEPRGRGFIVGTMVLYLSGDLRKLTGKATFYHHTKGQVVANDRVYRRS